jgi:branched-chain amino acid transport system permease protein
MLAYLAFFLTVAAILAIATLGLNLQWGISGQFNAGVVGFVALGAYALAVLTLRLGIPFALALPAALAVTGAAAALVGLATVRLRSDYLAIATFGVATSIQVLANNLEGVTGGSRGLVGIPRPFAAFGETVFSIAYLVMALLLLFVIYAALQVLLRSPWGRVLRGIRDDEVACAALGKHVVRFRLEAFVAGAMLMGLSGALYAGFVGAISPAEFLPIMTFQIWAMLIVGGSGSNRGAIAGTFLVWALWTFSGAAIVSALPAGLQAHGGALQAILVGLILVLTLLVRPQGILGGK